MYPVSALQLQNKLKELFLNSITVHLKIRKTSTCALLINNSSFSLQNTLKELFPNSTIVDSKFRKTSTYKYRLESRESSTSRPYFPSRFYNLIARTRDYNRRSGFHLTPRSDCPNPCSIAARCTRYLPN